MFHLVAVITTFVPLLLTSGTGYAGDNELRERMQRTAQMNTEDSFEMRQALNNAPSGEPAGLPLP